ncbi:MAG: alpha/beta hydrolase [Pseudomonadota bacterium]
MQDGWPQPSRIDVGGVSLAVHVAGDGPLVVLLHGFPDIAATWRQLLPTLVDAGYRVAAPDMRGYGGSDCPADVRDYAVDRLIGDLDGLLDALAADRAAFVGHDWGALLLWQYALQRRERVNALAALNVPFYPRPPFDPLDGLRRYFGDAHYVVDFNNGDTADSLFASNPQRYLRAMYRRLPVTRAAFDAMTGGKSVPFSMIREFEKNELPGADLLSDSELDERVSAFARTGFTPAINWYRNWSLNWHLTKDIPQRIDVPTLFIEAVDDVLIDPRHVLAMRAHIDELETLTLDQCGHWAHLEYPDEVGAALSAWLAKRQ